MYTPTCALLFYTVAFLGLARSICMWLGHRARREPHDALQYAEARHVTVEANADRCGVVELAISGGVTLIKMVDYPKHLAPPARAHFPRS